MTEKNAELVRIAPKSIACPDNADGLGPSAAAPARRAGGVGRKVWGALGLATFGLGAVGAVLPVLPTTPFILLAAFCFARSSQRLDAWFHGTALYRVVFSGYMGRRMMIVRAKLSLLVPVSVLMALGMYFTSGIPLLRAIIAVVWAAHIAYFGLWVKTDRAGA